jgi:hypothetical protein
MSPIVGRYRKTAKLQVIPLSVQKRATGDVRPKNRTQKLGIELTEKQSSSN